MTEIIRNQEPVITVEGLSKTFHTGFWMRPKTILNNVSFAVRTGECIGFLGPNGAGKTTTLKCILGLLAYERGEIRIFGQDARKASARSRIGYMPDNPYFYDHLKGDEFLDLAGRLHSILGADRKRRINELMELVGLPHARRLELRKYSKGMLQRIGIAQALINDPDIAIFDEPMEGLDPIGRKEVRDLLRNLNRERGKTIFFSTHILPDIEVICDRVIVIAGGALQGSGSLAELLPPGIRSWEVVFRSTEEAAGKLSVGAQPDLSRPGLWISHSSSEEDLNRLLSSLQSSPEAQIISVTPVRAHIEDIFYERFGNRPQGAAP